MAQPTCDDVPVGTCPMSICAQATGSACGLMGLMWDDGVLGASETSSSHGRVRFSRSLSWLWPNCCPRPGWLYPQGCPSLFSINGTKPGLWVQDCVVGLGLRAGP